MSELNSTKLVGELVTERPARSRVFERFKIDYCCGGRRPLKDVCEEADLDADRVIDAIREIDDAVDEDAETNWATADSAELVEHILSVHHAYLARELPRIDDLTEKVLKAHGGKHSELREVRGTFVSLRQELESHMAKEEQILFPAILGQGGGLPTGTFEGPIRVMMDEHLSAGSALSTLRKLTNDYTPPEDACNTWRAMLDALEDLERDLHQHIHEENNILFPRFAPVPGD